MGSVYSKVGSDLDPHHDSDLDLDLDLTLALNLTLTLILTPTMKSVFFFVNLL